MGKTISWEAISSSRPSRCTVISSIFSMLLILLSLFCFFAFDPIFVAKVASKISFSESALGEPSQATFLWSKPPMNNTFNFYIYNVTNPSHINWFGEKPCVIEVGPFAIKESEQKKEYKFEDDGNSIWYKNYKMFVYDKERSCEDCSYEAPIFVPNLPAIGAMADMGDPQYNVSKTAKWIISLGLILVGEYPFKVVTFGDLVFDGYDDPLLTLGHSSFLNYLSNTYNGGKNIIPFPIPNLKKMGFFVGYNNSNDEDYLIHSGKENIENIANIQKWAGMAKLPWWEDPRAAAINGSDSGSFSAPNLSKTDRLYMFQSYMCRSFYMEYSKDRTVHDIPGYNYEIPYSLYDTTLEENIGFRYPNREKVNYFPDWPVCPNSTSTGVNCDLVNINCAISQNLCHKCCTGSKVNDTYLLPPGYFPMACFPGKNEKAPFGMIFSAPHYLFSPPNAVNSVYGMDPNHEAHVPLSYTHEQHSGMITEVKFRLQINVPVYQNRHVIQTAQFPNKLIPVLWADSHAYLTKPAYDMIHGYFVTIPKAIYITKFMSLFVGVALILLIVAVKVRTRKQRIARERRNNALLKDETKGDKKCVQIV